MDLAGDVAKLVLKEIEREDGESRFVLMMVKCGDKHEILAARACFIKGVLHFQVFEVACARSIRLRMIYDPPPRKWFEEGAETFLFNLKTGSTLCEVFKQKFKRFEDPVSVSLMIRKISDTSSTLVFKTVIDDTNFFTDFHKTVNTYLEICDCCDKKSGETPQLPKELWNNPTE